jgi:phage shock protein C
MNHDSRPYDSLPHDQRRARRPNTTVRLTRSRHDRVLTGVLGGIAAYVGANPKTVRLLFALSTLLSGGILAVGYLLLWWLLPQGHA